MDMTGHRAFLEYRGNSILDSDRDERLKRPERVNLTSGQGVDLILDRYLDYFDVVGIELRGDHCLHKLNRRDIRDDADLHSLEICDSLGARITTDQNRISCI